MNNNVKFSILIPVYNTSFYLHQCLNSILNQSFSDYEVIIVNDGSTDESKVICQTYTNTDDRFILYSQENKGLLLTRRKALTFSRGQYVLFLDSDDYWEPQTLETLDKTITKYNEPDILIFNHNSVSIEGTFIYKHKKNVVYDRLISRNEYPEFVFKPLVKSTELNSLWSKVVKRGIVDISTNYDIYSGLAMGEDLLQSIPIILQSNNIVFIDEYLYNYRINPKSISRAFKIKNFFDYIKVFEASINMLLRVEDFSSNLIHSFYSTYRDLLLAFTFQIANSKDPINVKINYLKLMFNTPLTLKAIEMTKKIDFVHHNKLKKFLFFLYKIKFYRAILFLIVIKTRFQSV